MITEQDLIQMKFKRTDETRETSGTDFDWWYYTFEIGDLTLITNSSDQITDQNPWWNVQLFDYDTTNITTCKDLGDCIEVLTRITKV